MISIGQRQRPYACLCHRTARPNPCIAPSVIDCPRLSGHPRSVVVPATMHGTSLCMYATLTETSHLCAPGPHRAQPHCPHLASHKLSSNRRDARVKCLQLHRVSGGGIRPCVTILTRMTLPLFLLTVKYSQLGHRYPSNGLHNVDSPDFRVTVGRHNTDRE